MPEAAAPRYRFVTADGMPRLEGCLGALMCTRQDIHEGGDHWIVTLAVRGLHRGIDPLRPLLFFRGKYRHVDQHAGAQAPDLVDSADEPVQMYFHEH